MRAEIDDREHAIIPLFDLISGKRKVDICVKRLSRGDVAGWHNDELKFLIERKTWDDFAKSIIDGRLDEQLVGMNEIRKQCSCTVILIIEGRAAKQHGHIETKNLYAKLDHIMFRNEAHILYTQDTTATVTRIFDLFDHIDLGVKGGTQHQVTTQHQVDITTPKERSDEQILLDMFCAIPLISMNTARMLVTHGWSLLTLYEASPQEISNLTYSTGNKIPMARATKINNALGTKQCWIAILGAITGVTKQTAKIILNIEPDPYKWTAESLAAIEKTKNRKIGSIVSERIIRLLTLVV